MMPAKHFPSMIDDDAGSLFPSPKRDGDFDLNASTQSFSRPARLLMPTGKNALFKRAVDGSIKPVRQPRSKRYDGFDPAFTVLNKKRSKRTRKVSKYDRSASKNSGSLDCINEDDDFPPSASTGHALEELDSGEPFEPLRIAASGKNTRKAHFADDYRTELPSPISNAATPNVWFNNEVDVEHAEGSLFDLPESRTADIEKPSDGFEYQRNSKYPKSFATSSIENSPSSSRTNRSSFGLPLSMDYRSSISARSRHNNGRAFLSAFDDLNAVKNDMSMPHDLIKNMDIGLLIDDPPLREGYGTDVISRPSRATSSGTTPREALPTHVRKNTLNSEHVSRQHRNPQTALPSTADSTVLSESRFLPAISSTPFLPNRRGRQSAADQSAIIMSPVIEIKARAVNIDRPAATQEHDLPTDSVIERRSYAPRRKLADRIPPSRFTVVGRQLTSSALPFVIDNRPLNVAAADIPIAVEHALDRQKLELFRRLTSAMSILNIWRPTHVTAEKTLINETFNLTQPHRVKLPPPFPMEENEHSKVGRFSIMAQTPVPTTSFSRAAAKGLSDFNLPESSESDAGDSNISVLRPSNRILTPQPSESRNVSPKFKAPLPPAARQSALEPVDELVDESSALIRAMSVIQSIDNSQLLMPPPPAPSWRRPSVRRSERRTLVLEMVDQQMPSAATARRSQLFPQTNEPLHSTTSNEFTMALPPLPSLRRSSARRSERRSAVVEPVDDQMLGVETPRFTRPFPKTITPAHDADGSEIAMPPPTTPSLLSLLNRKSERRTLKAKADDEPALGTSLAARKTSPVKTRLTFVDEDRSETMPLPSTSSLHQSFVRRSERRSVISEDSEDEQMLNAAKPQTSQLSPIQNAVASIEIDESEATMLPPPAPSLHRSSSRRSLKYLNEDASDSSEFLAPKTSKVNGDKLETPLASKRSLANMSIIDRFIACQPVSSSAVDGGGSCNETMRSFEASMHNMSRMEPEPDDPVKALVQLTATKRVESFAVVIDGMLKNCKQVCKLAEGSYGDVYQFTYADGGLKVLKVMALLQRDNDAQEVDEPKSSGTTYKAALPEVKISTTIAAALQKDPANSAVTSKRNKNASNAACYAPSFIHIDPVRVVHGFYPARLRKCFVDFKRDNGEEVAQNPDPVQYADEQQYLLLESEHAGEELEKKLQCIDGTVVEDVKQLLNVADCMSIMRQLVLALAAAECALEFEHRDMHRSNIMIRKTQEPFIEFVVAGDRYRVPTGAEDGCGYQAIIIDMTWARMRAPDSTIVYADMANEEWLFDGTGDLQFDVYRAMRSAIGDACGGDWKGFAPATNVFWLGYASVQFRDYVTKLKKRRQRMVTTAAAKKTTVTRKHKERLAAAGIKEPAEVELPPEVPPWTFGTFNQLKGQYGSAMELVEKHAAFQDLRV